MIMNAVGYDDDEDFVDSHHFYTLNVRCNLILNFFNSDPEDYSHQDSDLHENFFQEN